MTPSPGELKAALRQRLRHELPVPEGDERRQLSAQASERLRRQVVWENARSVMCYFALPDEPDLSDALRAALGERKTVALPRYDPEHETYFAACITDLNRDCRDGRFGVVEPGPDCMALPLNQLDLVLVPGVAFDGRGFRLGRGKGFYDRLLESVTGIKCGVAWDHRVDVSLPIESHDVRLDCLLTPAAWRWFGPGPVLR